MSQIATLRAAPHGYLVTESTRFLRRKQTLQSLKMNLSSSSHSHEDQLNDLTDAYEISMMMRRHEHMKNIKKSLDLRLRAIVMS